MNDAQQRLRRALQEYAGSGDISSVEAVIHAHPELITDSRGEYPDFHRVMDLVIGERPFRVCRWISRNEELSLAPTDKPEPSLGGVPLWLSGDRLKDWALEEEESPSQDAIDWERYRGIEGGD